MLHTHTHTHTHTQTHTISSDFFTCEKDDHYCVVY